MIQLGRVHPRDVNAELAKESPRVMKWIPIRVSGVHLGFDDPFLSTKARLNLMGLPPEARARHRIHVGAHTEIMYALMSYGIPVDIFPMTGQQAPIQNTNHNRWIVRRKAREANTSATDGSTCLQCATSGAS
jgi:hypothetical protein